MTLYLKHKCDIIFDNCSKKILRTCSSFDNCNLSIKKYDNNICPQIVFIDSFFRIIDPYLKKSNLRLQLKKLKEETNKTCLIQNKIKKIGILDSFNFVDNFIFYIAVFSIKSPYYVEDFHLSVFLEKFSLLNLEASINCNLLLNQR